MSNYEKIDLISIFSSTPDPRIERHKKHQLIDIIIIAMCGVLCGADTWVDIEAFGHARKPWLKNFLKLPNGILPMTLSPEYFNCLIQMNSSTDFKTGSMR